MSPEACEVPVSKEDLESLKNHCQEMHKILNRYPSSNDPSNYFNTSMMRVKNYHHYLTQWVYTLPVEEEKK